MPTGDFDSKPSWADQVEEEGEDDKCVTSELLKGIPLATGDTSPEPELVPGAPLPPPKEVINGNIKTVTEYKIDEDGKKFKIVRTFRIETRKASKAVARRKVRPCSCLGGSPRAGSEELGTPFFWCL
uniref:eukaryotic translation initiation factor 3 subunit G n=1 Tax=Panthera onca TaxID=9690 RepID=UPI002955B78E|nr:eukaryotic translation initiation factor 3 subunit G [Panthera onca]